MFGKYSGFLNFKVLISLTLLLSIFCVNGCDIRSAEGRASPEHSDRPGTSVLQTEIPDDTLSSFSSLPPDTTNFPTDELFETSTDLLPSDSPCTTPSETVVETPFETPRETPSGTPCETPFETPRETSTEIPVDTSFETPLYTPTEIPEKTPSLTPTPDPTLPVESEIPPSEDPPTDEEQIKKSLLDLLRIGILPMGSTSYVWGGGWNKEDTGAGKEAVTIGLSPRWAEFSSHQDRDYDFHNTMYQIHDGLDCSGYVGWVLYNTFESEDGKEGYVMKSTKMAQSFSKRGFGEYTPAQKVHDWQAGDLMSKNGHVWFALGMCEDGSVVMMHCTPPGVVLSGTTLEDGSDSLAVALAEKYMMKYFPQWYEKYPDCRKECIILTQSSRMRWNAETLSDDEGLSQMSAQEVLAIIFEEKS